MRNTGINRLEHSFLHLHRKLEKEKQQRVTDTSCSDAQSYKGNDTHSKPLPQTVPF